MHTFLGRGGERKLEERIHVMQGKKKFGDVKRGVRKRKKKAEPTRIFLVGSTKERGRERKRYWFEELKSTGAGMVKSSRGLGIYLTH